MEVLSLWEVLRFHSKKRGYPISNEEANLSKQYRLVSWNVNGLRAVMKKGFFDWFDEAQWDCVGLQETKISAHQLTDEMTNRSGYHSHWSHAEKAGYSGTAVYSKEKPLEVSHGFGIEEFDSEGRIVTTRYKDFTLINIYYPNGQASPERLDYKMRFYDALLEFAEDLRKQGQKLVLCGDFNTAHKAIDLARPKPNERSSGFLPQERAWMDKFVAAGYIDTLREFNEEKAQYSWWSFRSNARARNVGWRIDYFFVSEELKENLVSAEILTEVLGSDHCPVSLTLSI